MTTTLSSPRTLKSLQLSEAGLAASFFNAYRECSEEIQAIIMEMAAIVSSDDAEQDEKEAAGFTLMEALFPGVAADLCNIEKQFRSSPAARQAKDELEQENEFFVKRVRSLMVERCITQHDLAAKAGVTQPAIANLLNRKCRPQQRTIAKLAEALDVTVESLLPPPQ